MKTLAATLLSLGLILFSSNANAWFFFILPGSVTSKIGDALTGSEGENCVGPDAICSDAIIMQMALAARMRWLQQSLARSIEEQKELVEGQNKVLESTVAQRTAELASQHKELEATHELVMSSVNYASRLQRGQLPRLLRLQNRFNSIATIWEPRDTIGGDSWWVSSSQHAGPYVLALADCTGHGVPGAMLSLLVSNSLERIYANDTSVDPSVALISRDHYVRTGLNQDRPDSESDDGCDAAVLRIDRTKKLLNLLAPRLDYSMYAATPQLPAMLLPERVWATKMPSPKPINRWFRGLNTKLANCLPLSLTG